MTILDIIIFALAGALVVGVALVAHHARRLDRLERSIMADCPMRGRCDCDGSCEGGDA
jgi:hypothetical protein